MRRPCRPKSPPSHPGTAGTPGRWRSFLVERAVFCWLILWEYESVLALQVGKLTAPQSAFHHRRIDAAHRRYLSSLRALAMVRKLAVPDVRVDVGVHHHHGRAEPAGPAPPCSCRDGAGRGGAGQPTLANEVGQDQGVARHLPTDRQGIPRRPAGEGGGGADRGAGGRVTVARRP